MTTQTVQLPEYENYGNYSSSDSRMKTLCFTDSNGNDFYYSYKTLVAARIVGRGLFVHENDWGATTGKHLSWIDGGGKEAKEKRLNGIDFKATVECYLREEN